MEEIYDQFLVCKICFEIYKRPKTLVCLHTFCTDCLEKHSDAQYERSYRYMLYNRSVSCPICRKKTDLPTGGVRRLPDNFLIANLADVVSRRKPTGKQQECEICKPDLPLKQRIAVSKCLDCAKLLCKTCVDLHKKTKVTQEHSLFDTEVEKEIECKVHADEVVRFYCEPCEVCVCVVCTFQEHKGHEISSFSEGLQKYQNSFDKIVSMCREHISDVKKQLQLITKCETEIKVAEDQIRDMAIDTITSIRKKERNMVEDLHGFYGEQTLEFLKEKQPLQEKLEDLQSTCNLTDIISKDKSLELLLLRREIQDKVNHLLETNTEGPPPNIAQQVTFVPGQVNFGYLHVDGQVKSCGNDDRSVDLCSSEATRAVSNTSSADSQTDKVCVSNQETLTDQSLWLGYKSQHRYTQTQLLLMKDNSTMPILPPAPKIRSRFTMTAPLNVENRQTMTVAIPTIKVKTQTIPTDTLNKCTNTFLAVNATESKYTNTPSSPKCERSTLTVTKYSRDELTDTFGLVTYCEKETTMPEYIMKSQNTMTECNVSMNQATLTNNPVFADKVTLTPRIQTLEKQSMTNTISKHDTGVEAKLIGTDKCVGTKAIVTISSGDGDGNVGTRDVMTNTQWKADRVQKATVSTMYEINSCDKETATKPQAIRNQETFTQWFNMSHNSTNTPTVELTHVSCGSDNVASEPQAKKAKLQTSGIQTELDNLVLSKLLNHYTTQKVDSWTNTDVTIEPRDIEKPKGVDASVSFGVSLFDLIECSTNTKATGKGVGTTMGSVVKSVNESTGTDRVHHNHISICTDAVDLVDQASGPENILQVDHQTSMGHFVQVKHIGTVTESKQVKHQETEMMVVHTANAAINTRIETRDVAILKRPHAISRGVNTKKFKTGDKSTETYKVKTISKQSSTNVDTCDSSCDPIKFSCCSKSEGTVSIILKDSATAAIPPNVTSRGSSPHRVTKCTDRASSPIPCNRVNVGVDIKPDTSDVGIGERTVLYSDSGVSTFKINLHNKAVSPIQNLVPSQDVGVATEVSKFENRALSPIKQCTFNIGVNTVDRKLSDRASSPVSFYGKDFGVSVSPEVQHQDTETIPITMKDSSTGTKHIRKLNSSTSMPQVQFSEKSTSTKRIQNINKMVSTDNTSCEDKHTMTYDITANYRELVTPSAAVTVSRGTNTAYKSMISKETSPVKEIFTEKASSPVRFPTFDKAVTANKAELMQPKEKFQAAGISVKPLKPISDSLKSNLESIEELRESDEEHATKEIQTETPPRSPRASFGRKAISALDLRQSPTSPSFFTHKEKFVLSNPRLGRYKMDESTFSLVSKNVRSASNNAIVCKVETSTNTNGVGLENKGTSTPPVEMEDKAVCTEAIHVTKNDKMAACISKLQTVQQRLEQQPVYVQAPTNSKYRMSKSMEESKCEKSQTHGEKVLSVSLHCTAVNEKDNTKSKTGLQPTADPPSRSRSVEKEVVTEVCPPFVSPILRRRIITKQESSEDSEDFPAKGKTSLARKKKPDLAELLERSSSLPEQDSPPYSIPKPKLQAIVPHVIPKLNVDASALQSTEKNRGSPKSKPRHRKLSPMKRSVTSPLMTVKTEARPLLPLTPEKQKARQERIARLKKDREKLQSPGPLKQNSSTSPSDPKPKVIKGGRPVNMQNFLKTDESSSSSS